jgi:hypothetical protein
LIFCRDGDGEVAEKKGVEGGVGEWLLVWLSVGPLEGKHSANDINMFGWIFILDFGVTRVRGEKGKGLLSASEEMLDIITTVPVEG